MTELKEIAETLAIAKALVQLTIEIIKLVRLSAKPEQHNDERK